MNYEELITLFAGMSLVLFGYYFGLSKRKEIDPKALKLLEQALKDKQDLINKFAGLSAQLFNVHHQPKEPIIMQQPMREEELPMKEIQEEFADLTGAMN